MNIHKQVHTCHASHHHTRPPTIESIHTMHFTTTMHTFHTCHESHHHSQVSLYWSWNSFIDNFIQVMKLANTYIGNFILVTGHDLFNLMRQHKHSWGISNALSPFFGIQFGSFMSLHHPKILLGATPCSGSLASSITPHPHQTESLQAH